MNLTERAAYLKGLKDGLNLSTETAEGKLIAALIELVDEIAVSVTDLEDMSYAITEELDAIGEELDSIEEVLDEEFEDEFEDDDEDDEDEDEDEDEEDEFEFDDEIIYEVKCPTCGEVINLDEEMLDLGGIECPACGEDLEFDASDVEEDE
ncbi:MAG: zinc ribbon domain-containing protein [Oscillospiraceae bacterium]|nr:zinc ribbon domain-containing protein [Oscillospiraceae bacterium]